MTSYVLLQVFRQQGQDFVKLMYTVHKEWRGLGAKQSLFLGSSGSWKPFGNEPSRKEKIGVRKYEVTQVGTSDVQAADLCEREENIETIQGWRW